MHKELIEEYAKDWMEMGNPWTKWEHRMQDESQWSPLGAHPQWNESTQYRRRKPKMIQIGSMEVPEPLTSGLALSFNECYYVPSLLIDKLYEAYIWGNSPSGKRLLANGLIHRTKEDAIIHAKALLKFTQEGDAK